MNLPRITAAEAVLKSDSNLATKRDQLMDAASNLKNLVEGSRMGSAKNLLDLFGAFLEQVAMTAS